MISATSGTSLANYLAAQAVQNSGAGATTSSSNTASSATTASTSTLTQAALDAVAKGTRASLSARALDKQRASLSTDLQAAMAKAGVKLSGTVQFALGTDGTLTMTGSDADKAAMSSLLKADGSRPSLSARVTTLAQDADKLSATIRQTAAISQAARYGGKGSGVVSLYTALTQTQTAAASVFSVSAKSSSLAYPGVLAAKA